MNYYPPKSTNAPNIQSLRFDTRWEKNHRPLQFTYTGEAMLIDSLANYGMAPVLPNTHSHYGTLVIHA